MDWDSNHPVRIKRGSFVFLCDLCVLCVSVASAAVLNLKVSLRRNEPRCTYARACGALCWVQ